MFQVIASFRSKNRAMRVSTLQACFKEKMAGCPISTSTLSLAQNERSLTSSLHHSTCNFFKSDLVNLLFILDLLAFA